MAKNVMKIPARVNPQTAVPIDAQIKRKVAGYARVSTDHDEQLTSYEAQLDYYTTLIKGHDDWEFAGMYSDMKTPSLIQFNDLRRLAGRGVS